MKTTKKKSFVLYADLIKTVEKLSDETKGQLFMLILKFVNGEYCETDDVLLQVALEPIKQQIIRDTELWEEERLKRSLAGKKGMQSRWGDNNVIDVITEDNSVKSVITEITDNVNATVNADVIVNENAKSVSYNKIPITKESEFSELVFDTLQDGKHRL